MTRVFVTMYQLLSFCFYHVKRGRIGAPEAKLSVVVSLISSLRYPVSIVVVFLTLFLVETQGLTRSTLPMKKTSRLAGIAAIVAGQRWSSAGTSFLCLHIFSIIIFHIKKS